MPFTDLPQAIAWLDSHIDFEVAVAPSVGELPAAPRDTLLFSDPPGPASLALQPIGAQKDLAGFDTQLGGTLVDSTLAADKRPRDSKAMRLRAHVPVPPAPARYRQSAARIWRWCRAAPLPDRRRHGAPD